MPLIDKEERLFHVHLTGFGPFGPHAVNPSWEAVKPLHDTVLVSPPEPLDVSSSPPSFSSLSIRLTSSLLPVSYFAATSFIPLLHAGGPAGKHRPDLVIHIGVGLEGELKIEQIGRKWGYDKPDVNGELAPTEEGSSWTGGRRGQAEKRFEEEEEELRTRVDGEKVLDWVRKRGLEHIDLSEDAGLYLCEFSFYTSMASALLLNREKPTPVQFIHVPPIGSPYTLDELTCAIKLLVWAIVNEGGLPT
ncbi:hypothetical protein JCM8547_006519 [Rhodosporidiobolus lusitaniae]